MSRSVKLNGNKKVRFLRTEVAKICNDCPYPDCKRGICDYFKNKISNLRSKYGTKRI